MMKVITLILMIISVNSELDEVSCGGRQSVGEMEAVKIPKEVLASTQADENLTKKMRIERAARMVNRINNSGTTWIAGKADFLSNDDGSPIITYYPPAGFLEFMGAGFRRGTELLSEWISFSSDDPIVYSNHGLPDHFDAREKWPECSSIRHIYDQGRCSCCGVVSVVSAFADRICIKTKGKVKSLRSVQEVLTCCSDCADGCNHSDPLSTWIYLKDIGVVTGGDYDSGKGCQPYQAVPCSHNALDDTPLRACIELPFATVSSCLRGCSNRKYKRSYKEDKRKVTEIRENLTEKEALREIYYNGPIVAIFEVYEDFIYYKSGVYQYVTGKYGGGHAVRVLGWGVEDGTPYWLAANSWNEFWGDKGTFRIVRGLNTKGNLKFETDFSAGTYEG